MRRAPAPSAAPVPSAQCPSARGSGLAALLVDHWYRPAPTALALALWPFAVLHGLLLRLRRLAYGRGWLQVRAAPVPLVVVGNLVVGGAGKTPTVIALVHALQAAGRRPGVVSRGHGRRGTAVAAVAAGSDAADRGDEPLLIARRTGVPVWVGASRVDAARALCAAHPEVDVLVADDGLQHLALAREAEIIVFDERGAGNGLLLPAGPLREPLPAALPTGCWLLYNAPAPTTALPGTLARRRLAGALPLAQWAAGTPFDSGARQALRALRGRPIVAAAGIAAPERFFAMLEAKGLILQRLPLPDHHHFTTLPWPADTPDVLVTEKDAVKLEAAAVGTTRVWVVGLDFGLAPELLGALLPRLDRRDRR